MPVDWIALGNHFPSTLIDEYRRAVALGGPLLLTVREITARTTEDQALVSAFLHELVRQGLVTEINYAQCSACGETLEEGTDHRCRDILGGSSIEQVSGFRLIATQTRDVTSVIAIHGMNTHGAWQEEFSWLIQIGYGYSIPTFIFKYGRILISPFLEWRQDRYVRQFLAKFRSKIGELASLGLSAPPDIIAHSFGTWIAASALESSSDIRYGRVVLTGSIVRTDFDWKKYVEACRVDAVLCHCGLQDKWVRIAPHFIPRSGQSGVSGFPDGSGVDHVFTPGFGHSDFFSDRHYRLNFSEVWIPFLTRGVGIGDARGESPRAPSGSPLRTFHLGHRMPWLLKTVVLTMLVFVFALIGWLLWRGLLSILGR